MKPEEYTTAGSGSDDRQEEADRNELLEYDLWEGQFSLSGEQPEGGKGGSKAVKNVRNQRRM